MTVAELTQKIPHRPDSLIAQCVQMCPGPEYKHFHVNLSVGCVRDAEKRCYLLLLGITYTTGNKTKRPTSDWKTKRKQFHGEIFVCDNFWYLSKMTTKKQKFFSFPPTCGTSENWCRYKEKRWWRHAQLLLSLCDSWRLWSIQDKLKRTTWHSSVNFASIVERENNRSDFVFRRTRTGCHSTAHKRFIAVEDYREQRERFCRSANRKEEKVSWKKRRKSLNGLKKAFQCFMIHFGSFSRCLSWSEMTLKSRRGGAAMKNLWI